MSAERPTLKDVYELVDRLEQKVEDNFPTKTEMRLTIALAVVGGSGVASIVTAFIAPQQAARAALSVAHLFI